MLLAANLSIKISKHKSQHYTDDPLFPRKNHWEGHLFHDKRKIFALLKYSFVKKKLN